MTSQTHESFILSIVMMSLRLTLICMDNISESYIIIEIYMLNSSQLSRV